MRKNNNITNNEDDYKFPKYDTQEIKEAFDCFDINNNGYIGVAELREIFQIINEEVSDEELDEMINLADQEGDGQVNWSNFYEFITGNGINEEIKKITYNNKILDNFKNGMGDQIEANEKNEVKIIGERQNRKAHKEISDDDDNKKEIFSDENVNDDNDSDNNSKEENFKRKGNNVTIKINRRKKYINNENEEDSPKQVIISNKVKENIEDIDTEENNIRRMLKKREKEQENFNRVNIVDIDDLAPHPKPLILKKPSVAHTPEPSEDDDEYPEQNVQNTILKQNVMNTKRTDLLSNNNVTIDKHEPVLQFGDTGYNSIGNSIVKEQLKFNKEKRDSSSKVGEEEEHSSNVNTSEKRNKTNSNDLSSRSIVFKTSKGFNDNNSMNITEKIIGQKSDRVIEDKSSVIKLKFNDSSEDKKSNEDSSKNANKDKSSGPSLVSYDNNNNTKIVSAKSIKEETSPIKEIKEPQEIEEHKKKILSKIQTKKQIPKELKLPDAITSNILRPNAPNEKLIQTILNKKIENKLNLEALSYRYNDGKPILPPSKTISNLDFNKKSNSLSSESISDLEIEANKSSPKSPSIKEVPITNIIQIIPPTPQTSKVNENEIPNDMITHIDNESDKSKRSPPSIRIVDPQEEDNDIDLDRSDHSDSVVSKKSGNIEHKIPLQVTQLKRASKTMKNKIKDSIVVATTHKKKHDMVDVIQISKSKDLKDSVVLKPKSKKESVKALIKKEQITPLVIKNFYAKFESETKTNVTYEEMIAKFEIFNSEEAKDFFMNFTSIDSSTEKTMNIGDILILLLNGTTLHNEEKFKFEFLIYDTEKSNFLSKSELSHILELNFLTYTSLEIEKRLSLIIDETKKMNLFDTEVFDFDVLMEILKNKPNLFFPS